jgi:hypothetical protein
VPRKVIYSGVFEQEEMIEKVACFSAKKAFL